MAQTKIANLVKAGVFADSVQAKLGDKIRLFDKAFVQYFEGEQSGMIRVPNYKYIGDAEQVAEGVAIDPVLLNQTSEDLDVVKVGKAVNITDEAAKGGFGDPIGEAENQLTQSIANGIDKAMFATFTGATLTHPAGATEFTGAVAFEALNLFGEDQDGDKFVVVNPNQLANIKQDKNYDKTTGKFIDMEVVASNRVAATEAFIMKPGAVGLYISKDVQVESDRDILVKSTVVSADSHFATHLRDASKVVKINLTV